MPSCEIALYMNCILCVVKHLNLLLLASFLYIEFIQCQNKSFVDSLQFQLSLYIAVVLLTMTAGTRKSIPFKHPRSGFYTSGWYLVLVCLSSDIFAQVLVAVCGILLASLYFTGYNNSILHQISLVSPILLICDMWSKIGATLLSLSSTATHCWCFIIISFFFFLFFFLRRSFLICWR